MKRALPLLLLVACAGGETVTTLEICGDPSGTYEAFATQDPDGSGIPLGVTADPCGTLELEPGTWYVRIDTGDPTCPVPWEPVEVSEGANSITIDVISGCFDG
ncbi:MAG: hypothetical protein H6737_14835 [Alphaproteobacteria bacterium]|nr:hypothetical protein [Alphaproteobacteria bacterium]